ncbi:uncharacterized protein LOC143225370 isoform X2 [Tachypleus tridentatus]|uniref:uncharacterized protein LOC143225370 isoform X2 n=1 Tax=Tachypleus tridentatus TaxID=6853 RepID=UPI003FD156CF
MFRKFQCSGLKKDKYIKKTLKAAFESCHRNQDLPVFAVSSSFIPRLLVTEKKMKKPYETECSTGRLVEWDAVSVWINSTWNFCVYGKCINQKCHCYYGYTGKMCERIKGYCWLMYCFIRGCNSGSTKSYIQCYCDQTLYGTKMLTNYYWYGSGLHWKFIPPPRGWRDSIHPSFQYKKLSKQTKNKLKGNYKYIYEKELPKSDKEDIIVHETIKVDIRCRSKEDEADNNFATDQKRNKENVKGVNKIRKSDDYFEKEYVCDVTKERKPDDDFGKDYEGNVTEEQKPGDDFGKEHDKSDITKEQKSNDEFGKHYGGDVTEEQNPDEDFGEKHDKSDITKEQKPDDEFGKDYGGDVTEEQNPDEDFGEKHDKSDITKEQKPDDDFGKDYGGDMTEEQNPDNDFGEEHDKSNITKEQKPDDDFGKDYGGDMTEEQKTHDTFGKEHDKSDLTKEQKPDDDVGENKLKKTDNSFQKGSRNNAVKGNKLSNDSEGDSRNDIIEKNNSSDDFDQKSSVYIFKEREPGDQFEEDIFDDATEEQKSGDDFEKNAPIVERHKLVNNFEKENPNCGIMERKLGDEKQLR